MARTTAPPSVCDCHGLALHACPNAHFDDQTRQWVLPADRAEISESSGIPTIDQVRKEWENATNGALTRVATALSMAEQVIRELRVENKSLRDRLTRITEAVKG